MVLETKSCLRLLVRILLSLFVISSLLLVASLGGFLNRCRGGYVQYGEHMGYWAAHIVSRHTLSLSTGLLVLIFGCHLRAGIVVWLLTQWSLYASWEPYMMIGENSTDYRSREGVFDWMLGRQDVGWNFTQRLVREYSGMSLRGLVWTAPQGYALQQLGFGWQYSLSGSLMGAMYLVGGLSHIPEGKPLSGYLDGAISFSEFYWGTFVWFVLIIACLSQCVRRLRKWVFSHSPSNHAKDNQLSDNCKYESLNRTVTNVAYNLFFAVFWLLLAGSTVFYSLIIQEDIRNKGETFFGLFSALISMTVLLTWTWNSAYIQKSIDRQQRKSSVDHHIASRRVPGWINNNDYFEQRGVQHGFYEPAEADRLLPWPYSHPDKGFVDSRPHNSAGFSSNSSPTAGGLARSTHPIHHYAHAAPKKPLPSTFIKIWSAVENWLYLDIFVLIRYSIGVLSLLSVLSTIVLCFVSFVWDLHSPIFDPQFYVCVNGSIWNQTAF